MALLDAVSGLLDESAARDQLPRPFEIRRSAFAVLTVSMRKKVSSVWGQRCSNSPGSENGYVSLKILHAIVFQYAIISLMRALSSDASGDDLVLSIASPS
jgi:hypothetical protein